MILFTSYFFFCSVWRYFPGFRLEISTSKYLPSKCWSPWLADEEDFNIITPWNNQNYHYFDHSQFVIYCRRKTFEDDSEIMNCGLLIQILLFFLDLLLKVVNILCLTLFNSFQQLTNVKKNFTFNIVGVVVILMEDWFVREGNHFWKHFFLKNSNVYNTLHWTTHSFENNLSKSDFYVNSNNNFFNFSRTIM